MSVLHYGGQNFDELVKEGNVLVDFYASWCGPCKMLGPVLEALAEERKDLKIIKVNVDENEELAGRFSVMSIPTIYLYKDGKIVSERKGFSTKEMLNDWINKSL